MRKLNKKGAFETINLGMVSFLTFVMVVVLSILLVSQVKQTSIVCPDTLRGGECLSCPSGFVINTTNQACCNTTDGAGAASCVGVNLTGAIIGNNAYNSTELLQEAADLPPQFAQIIVIVIIIVGILGMLAFIGYGAYQKMKR